MSRGLIRDDVTDTAGGALQGVQVSVYDAGTFTLATVYNASEGGAVVSNPLTTDNLGVFECFAATGEYDLKIEAPGGDINIYNVPAFDGDSVNALEAAVAAAQAAQASAEATLESKTETHYPVLAGATVVTVAEYTVGDGTRDYELESNPLFIGLGEITETNSTTLTLASAPVSGATLTVIQRPSRDIATAAASNVSDDEQSQTIQETVSFTDVQTDQGSPAYLTKLSDMNFGAPLNLLWFIDKTKWSGIRDRSNTDDLTVQTQAWVDAIEDGRSAHAPAGLYNVEDTITFYNKLGCVITGESSRAFGAYGTAFNWNSTTTTKSVFQFDYWKQSSLKEILVRGENTTTKRPRSLLLFKEGDFSSHGPATLENIYALNGEYGIMLGDTDYANNYNVSEFIIRGGRVEAKYGLYVAGVASGSQNVNNWLYSVNFGGTDLLRAIWSDGGHFNASNCTANGNASPEDSVFLYMTGDRSITQPIQMIGSYCEQMGNFFVTESTATASQWSRTAKVVIDGGYLNCNRAGTSQMFIDCYKNADIHVKDVTVPTGDINYEPNADQAFTGYSATAPADRRLVFSGRSTIQGTITTARGGYIDSSDSSITSTYPTGFMFPNSITDGDADNVFTLTGAIKDLKEYSVQLSYSINGGHDVDTITGGKVGDRIHIKANPSQATFRPPIIKHGTGNIYTATSADVTINHADEEILLELHSDGNWQEVSRLIL